MHATISLNLSQISGYCLTADLGMYLDIHSHEKCVSQSEFYYFLVEKMSNWKAKHLSLAGCITLASFVLNTIPMYYMQINHISRSVCEGIDKK